MNMVSVHVYVPVHAQVVKCFFNALFLVESVSHLPVWCVLSSVSECVSSASVSHGEEGRSCVFPLFSRSIFLLF